jgi:hypothetical protein
MIELVEDQHADDPLADRACRSGSKELDGGEMGNQLMKVR